MRGTRRWWNLFALGVVLAALTAGGAALSRLVAAQTVPPQSDLERRLVEAEQQETKIPAAEAVQRYEQLLKEFEATGQALGQGRVKLGLARLATAKEPGRAIILDRAALDLFDRAGNVRYSAEAHFDLGTLLLRTGNPDEALTHYRMAASSFAQAGDRFQEGRSYNGMGQVQVALGYYDRADSSFQTTCRIARDTKNDVLLGRCLNNLGLLAYRTGRYNDALEYHRKSKELKVQAKDEIGAARADNGLGNVYYRLGAYPKALEYYQACLKIFSAKLPAETSLVLNNIGSALKDSGRLDEALDYLQKAYDAAAAAADVSQMAMAQNNQGYTFSLLGRYEDSIKSHQAALGRAEKSGLIERQIHALHGIGNNQFRQSQFAAARDTFGKVLALSEQIKSADETVGAHVVLGRTLEKLGQNEAALKEYQAAISVIEDLRSQVQVDLDRADYLENNLEAYTDAVHLLASRPSPESQAQAFVLAEKYRARMLLEMLASSRTRVKPRADAALQAEQEAISAKIAVTQAELRQFLSGAAKADPERIATLRREADRLYDSYRLLQGRVEQQDPHYKAFVTPEPVTVSALERALPEDTILLEYTFDHRRNLMDLPRESWGFVFAVTKQGMRQFPIEGVSQIGEDVVRLRELLSSPDGSSPAAAQDRAEFAQVANRLYDRLVAPARPLLTGKQRIVVVPDRFIATLPFEVLLEKRAAPDVLPSWQDLPYLVSRFSISYTPSATFHAQSLERLAGAGSFDKELLAVADPVYEKEDVQAGAMLEMLSARPVPAGFERLTHSAAEAAGVASLFPAGRRDLLVREQANETAVKSALSQHQYRYLLFSVHGIASARYPQFSSLVLSRKTDTANDGLLQVHEIYNLRLNSEVAALSACETAMGKTMQGEGLVGLAHAFLYAGARSVIASLWQVDDQSTGIFMRDTFARMVKTNAQGKAAALRSAKLALLRDGKHAHPFFWAPFVLSGN